MLARDIMTRDPACCTPTASVQEAAKLMKQHDCGCIPVVDDSESKHLLGVITDRDLACRGIAEGLGTATAVETLMSRDPACCSPDSEIAEIERIMAGRQVRRVPVTDGEGCCVGIVAQADLALAEDRGVSDREVGRVVEQISKPKRRGAREPELQLH